MRIPIEFNRTGKQMVDVDENEVDVGDVVRVLLISEDVLNCLTKDERPHHLSMIGGDFMIDEILEDGRKASVTIQWECDGEIAIGGLLC